MEKESPINLRKSLIIVENFKREGIGFIPIPVLSEEHRRELVILCGEKLEELAQIAEKDY
ncbi:unnamed protein product [marine sediment metagenome]|uniref:Uncharacterized protein n=1 Tax=marine sediment metagenome TaxID=412755 RepID=X0WDW2_9ZZZZ